MSDPSDAGLAMYVAAGVVAANVVYQFFPEPKGKQDELFSMGMSVVVAFCWPAIVGAAMLYFAAWLLTMPGRMLARRMRKGRQ